MAFNVPSSSIVCILKEIEMTSIQLEKIKQRGHKFLSNVEFSEIREYARGVTYFIYDPSKDTDAPKTSGHNRYMMRADRCVYIGDDGSFNEIYEVTDSSGKVLCSYGASITLVSGPSNSDRSTITIPACTKYSGYLADLPNTSNRVFIGWYRNNKLITGDTAVNDGDVLTARFSLAGEHNAFPYGRLFMSTGEWTYKSNGFDMSYLAVYEHEESHLRIQVSAQYSFSSDSVTRDSSLFDVRMFGLISGSEGKLNEEFTQIVPIRANNTWTWYSPYGWKVVADDINGDTEFRLDPFDRPDGSANRTIFLFEHRNSHDGGYSGTVTKMYLGKGTGTIRALKMDGTLRVVISSAGSASAASNVNVTWGDDDLGALYLDGAWEYIGIGTSSSTASANTARPLISVPRYEAPKVCAYGFGVNSSLSELFIVNPLTLVGTSSTSGAFCGNVYASSFVTASSVTPTSYGLYGLTYNLMSIDSLTSIVSGWGNGLGYPSVAYGIGGPLVIQHSNISTQYLATGASKFIEIELRDCSQITGSSTSVLTFTAGNVNTDYEVIIHGIIGDTLTLGTYAFYNMNCIIWFTDMEIEDVRQLAGTSGWKAASGCRFFGKDLRGYVFNKTGVEPINQFLSIVIAYA